MGDSSDATPYDQPSLPRRGEKDFEPHGTRAQIVTLTAFRAAMHAALSRPRTHPPSKSAAAPLEGIDEFEADEGGKGESKIVISTRGGFDVGEGGRDELGIGEATKDGFGMGRRGKSGLGRGEWELARAGIFWAGCRGSGFELIRTDVLAIR